MTTLAGLTMLMSGGSRGIGLEIATRAAGDGANVVLLAKTAEPQARLEGTVHTAAAQIQPEGPGRLMQVVSRADVVRRPPDARLLRRVAHGPSDDVRTKRNLFYGDRAGGFFTVRMGRVFDSRARVPRSGRWPMNSTWMPSDQL
jgi:hypothetical protein